MQSETIVGCMSGHLYKLLTLTIALATAGAQVVCACPTPVFHHALPPVTKVCAGEKECCRKLQASKPVEPAKQEPCNQCNLKHRTEQATPDRQAGSSVPQLALNALAVPASLAAPVDILAMQPRVFEALASPPLLTDLFHVHSLLLN